MDKPAGPTSHDVIARVRQVLGERSAGHTGTLDPFATGLLVVLLGRATRLARFLDDLPKVYRATVRLGQSSDTDDSTGSLRPVTGDLLPDAVAIRDALQGFVGTYAQRPPAYSAKKIDGKRAYAMARRGKEVELPPVEVTIHSAELLGYAAPDAEIRVSVGGGTYVRALARDLGERLGVPAHCAALRREAIGEFRVTDAVPMEQLVKDVPVLTPAALVAHLPSVEVTVEEVKALSHGRRIPMAAPSVPPPLRPCAALSSGRLFAVGHSTGDGWFQPDVVLEPA
ncbi:MAG: tRNA pseudouridine(55) synthase TruB [Gemmatimonadales bacterium]